MTGESNSPDGDRADRPGRPASRGRMRRAGLWSLAVVAFLMLLGGGLVIAGLGQTLTVPVWVRDRIEARIERNLPGMEIEFGDVELVVNRGWRPRVGLRDVRLETADGLPIAQLANAQASLAMRPLLRGQVQPKSISLSGVFAFLRRDSEGNLSLTLGNGGAPINRAGNLPELVETLDAMFATPLLSALVSVEVDGVTLQYEDAFKNRAWTLDGGRIRLDRDADHLRASSVFALLTGADYASSFEMNYSSRFGSPEAEFGIVVEDVAASDIAAQSVALGWLDVLRAPISGALRGSVNADGRFGQLSASLQIGAGAVQPTEAARPIPFQGAHSYFTYHPEDQALVFDEVMVSSDWGRGTAEGRAYLGVEGGSLRNLIGQLTLTNLSINPDDLYETPLSISRATADFRVGFAPFRVALGELQATQQNTRLLFSGGFSADAAGWKVALDGTADVVTPDQLLSLWPERAVPKPRKWVTENLSGGRLEDINFALRLRQDAKPDIYLDFDYADATVRAVKTLPMMTNASGQATLAGGRFVVTATEGRITPDAGGPLDVAGTSFIIPDVDVKPATPAVVRITARSSVTTILSLLDRPPLSVLKDTTLPVDMAQGMARVGGTLALPLKPKVPLEEMEFHLSGTVEDVSSDVLVPGYNVAAPRLEVSGNQEGITIAGTGRIEDLPIEVSWRQPLGPEAKQGSRVEGRIELSPETIDTFRIGLPPGSVSGRGSARVAVDIVPAAPPVLSVESDLAGIGLSIPQLGWSKSRGSTGELSLSARLGAQPRVDNLTLRAAGLAARGEIDIRPGGGLDRASFDSVSLGGWLDAPVDLIGRSAGAPDIRIRGGTLDLRRAEFGASGGGAGIDSGELQVALNTLRVTDTLALTDFAGAFTLAGGLTGRFRGKVNGQAEVTGEISPSAGRSAVRVRSEDAGGVVRSAGLLKQARGGSFDLTLLPAPAAGQFDGRLRITNTQIQDAPAIAALLNSISVVGLLDELSGQGIQFSEVVARFRLGPRRITVFESSATGPSIGLSMDGVFDVVRGTMQMQGVISPIYMLNQIGNLVSRRGEGVIGFNYSLTGPAQNPRVQVNPLSVLAPGILRDIMRSAPPPIDENAPPVQRTPATRPDDAFSGR